MTQDTLQLVTTDRIETNFNEFHVNHPEVYTQLVQLAHEWRSFGPAKLGIATLFEFLRWKWQRDGLRDVDGYKLNNNYRALYARKIMDENPDLADLFNTRERTTTIRSN